jgi:hypothetical protein
MGVIEQFSNDDRQRHRARRQRGPIGSEGAPGRSLPHSLEAEEFLLSCCMLDGADVVHAAYARGVRAESFYEPKHGLVWAALQKLWQEQKPTEVFVVAEEMKASGELERVGGYPFLVQVSGRQPTSAQAPYFTEKVVEQAELRAVIRAATATVEMAYGYTGGGVASDPRLVESLDELQRLRVKAQRDLPAMMTDGEFGTAELPEPPMIIDKVMHVGRRTLLVAPSKAAKTFTAMDMGISIAAGVPWLGFRTQRVPVLHIDLELPTWGLRQRRDMICQHRGIAGKLDIDWWSLDGYQRSIDELMPLIAARAPRGKFGMITIEPAYVIMGRRDENDNADVTDFMNQLAWLARLTGAAVLCTHHFAKGDASKKEAKDRASGAGAWLRAPDTAITLTPLAEEQGEDAYAMEFIERNMKRHAPVGVKFEFPIFRLQSGLDTNALREAGAPRTSTPEDVVKVLGEDELTFSQWLNVAQKRIRGRAGEPMSERTFARRVEEAVEAGKVQKVGPYYANPEAMAARRAARGKESAA